MDLEALSMLDNLIDSFDVAEQPKAVAPVRKSSLPPPFIAQPQLDDLEAMMMGAFEGLVAKPSGATPVASSSQPPAPASQAKAASPPQQPASPPAQAPPGASNPKIPPAYQTSEFRNATSALDSLADNFGAAMTTSAGKYKSHGDCAHCGFPVEENAMKVFEKVYHGRCLACSACGRGLSDVQVALYCFDTQTMNHAGQFMCRPCWDKQFVPTCKGCNEQIREDTPLQALGATWHGKCFKCEVCKVPFNDRTYYEKEGKAYCSIDFSEKFKKHCSVCNLALFGEFLELGDLKVHSDCFKCQDCQTPFPNGQCFVHEGLPYCMTHYNRRTGGFCAHCNQEIAGSAIGALDKKWHPEHFVCLVCNTVIGVGASFGNRGGRPVCVNCVRK